MSKETLLFIHGWPDDSSVWSNQINALKEKYDCHTFDLPRTPKDFPELADLVIERIKAFNTPVILIGHDWGAYLSYIVQKKHPELVKGLITLDVGGDVRPQSFLQAVGIASYQLWLIIAWFLKSDKMSRGFAKLMKAPRPERVTSELNYLYYFFWRRLFRAKVYWPRCPLLYVYGTRKPLMFHSKKWLKFLESSPKYHVHVFKETGHWMMRDEPDVLNKVIEKFCNFYTN
jgi:pimeloyl-ACP methyl ester carboxylesterase